jgi:predicted RND superfamily exporter protein
MYLVNNFNASGMEESYVLIKGNITSPTLLKAMDQTLENMVDDRYITFVGTKSIVSVIRTRSALDSNFSLLVSQYDEDGDGLPDSHVKDIYDYLYENDDNARLVLKKEDGSYKSTLIRVKPTSQGNSEHEILYEELKEDIVPLIDAGYYAEVTGGPVAMYVITDSLERSQWNSLLLTLILTMLILAIVFYFLVKSILIGVLTSLPVMIALLWSMGVMYLIGMNFNVLTITITSMTIGLGITYAIHLGHRFVEELKEHSPEKAIERTVMNTGSSIMGAVGTTIGGFGVLILSTMPPMRDFGIIAVMAILLSFILTVFVLPSFLIIWAKRRIKN